MTEKDIASFASLTGDSHPQHTDAEWAASSTAVGERIAPGLLTLACSLGLVRLDPARVIAVYGFTDVVFTRPVRIGDEISVRGRIASMTPSGAHSLVTVTLRTVNQHGKMVCRSRGRVLWRDAPPSLPAGGG